MFNIMIKMIVKPDEEACDLGGERETMILSDNVMCRFGNDLISIHGIGLNLHYLRNRVGRFEIAQR